MSRRKIPLCAECKHCVVDPGRLRPRCGLGAPVTGAPITCADARGRHPWSWCGPNGLQFQHRLPWWRRAMARLGLGS